MANMRKMIDALMRRKKKGSNPEGFGKITDEMGKDVTGEHSAMPKKKSKLRMMIDMLKKRK